MAKQLRITLIKSPIGATPKQRVTAAVLGLKKMHRTVVMPDNVTMRGMVWRVRHLMRVEKVEEQG